MASLGCYRCQGTCLVVLTIPVDFGGFTVDTLDFSNGKTKLNSFTEIASLLNRFPALYEA